jgi:hypothetical protein
MCEGYSYWDPNPAFLRKYRRPEPIKMEMNPSYSERLMARTFGERQPESTLAGQLGKTVIYYLYNDKYYIWKIKTYE